MNHVYRRIWSTAKHCWVVGSELATPRAKRSSGAARRLAVSAACGLLAVTGVNTARADIFYSPCNKDVFGFYQCTPFIGHDTKYVGASSGSGSERFLAMGNGASVTGKESIVFGHQSVASGDRNAVFGYSARATRGYAAAFGAYSKAYGVGAVAVGNDSHSSADNAIAVGSGSYASAANSVALGANSVASEQNAVSVGNSSVKRRVVNVADARLNSTSSDAVTGKQLNATNSNVTATRSIADNALAKANVFSGLLSQTSASGNVRLGASNSGTVLDVRNSASANRKITGVADATLSTASTDAVSGKQLNSTNSNVVAARAVADAAKTNADSALAKANTLSGLLSETSASGNVRLGASNSGTVLDVRNSAGANRRIAGVADATLSSTSTDAVTGRQLNTTNSNVSTAMSDASSAKTTANTALTQVGTLNGLLNQVSASGNVRVGEKNSGTVVDVRNSANANRKLTGVADGVVSASSYEAVNGRQLSATNDKLTTVEGVAKSAGADAAVAKTDAAKALAETAVLGGLVAQVSASGDVRLGGKNSGATLDVRNNANANRKISGVADGILSASSAEAVSGRQLHSTNSRVSDLEDIAQFVSIGSAPFSERAEAGVAGVAVGNSAKTGLEGGTAVGTFAEAMGKNSTAIGRAATVSVDSENGFAMGVGAQVGGGAGGANEGVAIGAGARVASGAHGSLALGNGSQAVEEGVASFGGVGVQRRLVNIARGTADHNATTVSQFKDSSPPRRRRRHGCQRQHHYPYLCSTKWNSEHRRGRADGARWRCHHRRPSRGQSGRPAEFDLPGFTVGPCRRHEPDRAEWREWHGADQPG